MPLTDYGFIRPTFEDLLETKIERAKEMFGEDIDTSELSVLGKYIRLEAYDLAELYETAEGVYFSRFPHTATGVSLDRLGPFAGITRNAPTASSYEVRFTGTKGTVIDEGFLVSSGDVQFHTNDNYVIGEDGTVTATVESDGIGTDYNVVYSAINNIVNPTMGVDLVEGIRQLTSATDTESDQEFRDRFDIAIGGIGDQTDTSIKGAIMRVSGINNVTIIENDEMQEKNGIPPKSFKCIVSLSSGDDSATRQSVGEAIFSKKPLGIKSVGSIAVDVKDEDGISHTVYFDTATQVDLYLTCDVIKSAEFEEYGVENIKTSLSSAVDELDNGETVYWSNLFGYIYATAGVENVKNLKLSTDGESWISDDIELDAYTVARLPVENITINLNGG
ncbi:MAG: baseplate J/gp47 family protein [Lachnospiraceae bacterium]